tara:strand:+ start:548 stop:679 length:132 start_codon:yes stop_codon:yes gene_type:complete
VLIGGDQVFGGLIDRRNPAQRLMRRRNIVSMGCKNDERIADLF